MNEGRELNLFEDVKFNAVHQSFLSSIIMSCILKKPEGIYNIASNGSISKASFAIKLAEYLNFNSFKYKLISSKELGRLAKRSKDMTLDNTKAKEFFNIDFPSLDETLRLVSNDYKKLI